MASNKDLPEECTAKVGDATNRDQAPESLQESMSSSRTTSSSDDYSRIEGHEVSFSDPLSSALTNSMSSTSTPDECILSPDDSQESRMGESVTGTDLGHQPTSTCSVPIDRTIKGDDQSILDMISDPTPTYHNRDLNKENINSNSNSFNPNANSNLDSNTNANTTGIVNTPPRRSPLLPTLQDQWNSQYATQNPRYIPMPAIAVQPRHRSIRSASLNYPHQFEDSIAVSNNDDDVAAIANANADADADLDAFYHMNNNHALSIFGQASPPSTSMQIPRQSIARPMPPISASMFPSSLGVMRNFFPPTVSTSVTETRTRTDLDGSALAEPSPTDAGDGEDTYNIMDPLNTDDLECHEEDVHGPETSIGSYFPSPDVYRSFMDTNRSILDLPQTSYHDPFTTATSAVSRDTPDEHIGTFTTAVDRNLLQEFSYGGDVGSSLPVVKVRRSTMGASTVTPVNSTQVPMPPLPTSNPPLESDQEPSPSCTDASTVPDSPNQMMRSRRIHSVSAGRNKSIRVLQSTQQKQKRVRGQNNQKKRVTRSLPLRKRVNHGRNMKYNLHDNVLMGSTNISTDLCTPISTEESDPSMESISLHATKSIALGDDTGKRPNKSSKKKKRSSTRGLSLCRTAKIQTIQFHPSSAGVSPEVISDEMMNSIDTETGSKCRCSKSKCIKLYCECFQRGVLCGIECVCKDCKNTLAESGANGIRTIAINEILEKRPDAFYQKFKRTDGGCNCKKNKCLKKYCVCFASGRACDDRCQCINCENDKFIDDSASEGSAVEVQNEMMDYNITPTIATHVSFPMFQSGETVECSTNMLTSQGPCTDINNPLVPGEVASI